jgi:hypothetical protein
LAAFGAIPDPARVVFDGKFCTGGGMMAGVDVGIAIVSKIAVDDYGRKTELMLEYAPAPLYGVGRPELADPGHISKVRSVIGGMIAPDAIAESASTTTGSGR